LPGLDEKPLYGWALRLVLPRLPAGHPLRRKRKFVQPTELADFRLVAAPEGHRSRARLEEAFATDGIPLDVAIESTDPFALRQIAEGSSGLVAAIPDDAFGRPDGEIGPQLTTSGGVRIGGAYAVYWRTASETPTPERDAAILRCVMTLRTKLTTRRGSRTD
jgi:DNA-binding transcriptional LysR family regulator